MRSAANWVRVCRLMRFDWQQDRLFKEKGRLPKEAALMSPERLTQSSLLPAKPKMLSRLVNRLNSDTNRPTVAIT